MACRWLAVALLLAWSLTYCCARPVLTLRTTQRFVGAACAPSLPFTLTVTDADHRVGLPHGLPSLWRITPQHPRGVRVGRFVPCADGTPFRSTWTVTAQIPVQPGAYQFVARVPGSLFQQALTGVPLTVTRITSSMVLPGEMRTAQTGQPPSALPVIYATATASGYRTTLLLGIQVEPLGLEPMRFLGAMRMTAQCSTATTIRWGEDQTRRGSYETTPNWLGCGGWGATCVIDEAAGDVHAPDPVRLITYTIEDPQSHVVIESRSLTFTIAYPTPAPARQP